MFARHILSVLLFVCILVTAHARNLRVLVQAKKNNSSINFTAVSSPYIVYSGKKKVRTLKQDESLTISFTRNHIVLSSWKKKIGTYTTLKIVSKNPDGIFSLQPADSAAAAVSYSDHLEVLAKNSSLRFLNVIGLEKYIEGTVAAEAGNDADPEFYKVQAIISRTYALGHLNRHAKEGFNLCDQVHCQAYNGILKDNKPIADAVLATKNKIIVDSSMRIITAAYFSNCGGQTAAAEDVWSKPLPYLQSINDPFCFNGVHAFWEQKIPLSDWLTYLKKKKLLSAYTDMNILCDTTFCYFPLKREALFSLSNNAVAMRAIRDDWKLKSAFFSINQAGDTLIFNGRGFGHGVGLCQEGAMQMAKLGHSFEEIISFYYKDVSVVDADLLSFLIEK